MNTSRTQLDKNAGRIVSLAWSSQNQFAVAYQAQEDNPKNGVIQAFDKNRFDESNFGESIFEAPNFGESTIFKISIFASFYQIVKSTVICELVRIDHQR